MTEMDPVGPGNLSGTWLLKFNFEILKYCFHRFNEISKGWISIQSSGKVLCWLWLQSWENCEEYPRAVQTNSPLSPRSPWTTKHTSRQLNLLDLPGFSAKRWAKFIPAYFSHFAWKVRILQRINPSRYVNLKKRSSTDQIITTLVFQVNNDGSCADGHSLTCVPAAVRNIQF